MATARISESMWTCTKRWMLEKEIAKSGHKWPSPKARSPMSGAECIARILAFLDQRSRPDGNMIDLGADDIEEAAGWVGQEGMLVQCLKETGWIDETDLGLFWHDYGAFNGQTIRDRLKKRAKRPGTGRGFRSDLEGDEVRDNDGDKVGDEVGDKEGDEVGERLGDEVGASGSGSGSGSGVRVRSPDLVPSQTRERLSPDGDLHPLALAWNRAAEGTQLPKAHSVSPSRRRHADNRLKEADAETWERAYRLIATDPFCRGENDRGWRADFDYALRPEKSGKWLDLARSNVAPTESTVDRMARILGESPRDPTKGIA